MNCKEIQSLMLENELDELRDFEIKTLSNHISTCSECKLIYEKVIKAENIISLVRDTNVELDEYLLTENIFEEINVNREKSYKPKISLNDLIFDWIQKSVPRYSFGVLLLFFFLLYGYQEYYTISKLETLEKQLTNTANTYEKANSFSSVTDGVSWIYDFYKYLNGNSPYWQVNNNTIVIKKENLKKLIADYNSLSDEDKLLVLKIKQQLLPKIKNEDVFELQNISINKSEVEQQIKRININRGQNENE